MGACAQFYSEQLEIEILKYCLTLYFIKSHEMSRNNFNKCMHYLLIAVVTVQSLSHV